MQLWNAYTAAHYAYEDHRNYCSGCAHLWYTNEDYECTTREAIRTEMLNALNAWQEDLAPSFARAVPMF